MVSKKSHIIVGTKGERNLCDIPLEYFSHETIIGRAKQNSYVNCRRCRDLLEAFSNLKG